VLSFRRCRPSDDRVVAGYGQEFVALGTSMP
jgi:hypothetical protein